MAEYEKTPRKIKIQLIISIVLLTLTIFLQAAARNLSGFGEWYGKHIYPIFVYSIGGLFSSIPVSVSELLLYSLAVSALLYLFYSIYKRSLFLLFQKFILAASILFFLYTVCCGINYYRIPFSDLEGFEKGEIKKEDLIDYCDYIVSKLNEEALIIKTDEKGLLTLPDNVNELAVLAMNNLGKAYPSLSGYYPKPKPLLIPELLSIQQLSGIYSPFTVEANYNSGMTSYNIPMTACHELSHLKGFMREDEANFIAILACENSDSHEFKYSGYMLSFLYASNALYKNGEYDQYSRIYESLPDSVKQQYRANSQYWSQYEGKISKISDAVNDSYLKINSQEDGILSYDRVVDLLLADYRKNKSTN